MKEYLTYLPIHYWSALVTIYFQHYHAAAWEDPSYFGDFAVGWISFQTLSLFVPV